MNISETKKDNSQLQNEFTSYLLISLKRQKMTYLQRKAKLISREILSEVNYFAERDNGHYDDDLSKELPLLDNIENVNLLFALNQAQERELKILLARVLEEHSFTEIAKELGLSYKATTNSYYRLLERLKKILGGE